MRARLLMLFVVLVAVTAAAQNYAPTTPVSQPSVARYVIGEFHFYRSSGQAQIGLLAQDSGQADLPNKSLICTVPSAIGAVCAQTCTNTTTLAGLAGAMNVTRSNEPAGAAAAQQYRILGYLLDRGCMPSGTLNNTP